MKIVQYHLHINISVTCYLCIALLPQIVAVSSVGGCKHITQVSVESFKGFSEAGIEGNFSLGAVELMLSSVRFIRGVVVHAASVSFIVDLLPLRVRFLPGPGEVGGSDVVDVVVNWDSEDCGRIVESEEEEDDDDEDASVVRSTKVFGVVMLDPCQKLIQGDLAA